MYLQHRSNPLGTEASIRPRLLSAAQHLFARQGYEKTTTRQLAEAANVAEGTLFRYFPSKNDLFIEVVTQGWTVLLTDLLTELSEMASYKAIAQVMKRRMLNLRESEDLMRVCFMEAQFHPDLRDRLQHEIIQKMTHVTEAFIQTGIDRGIYRPLNPKLVAQVFLGMFMVAGFSQDTLLSEHQTPRDRLEMAETLADVFLNGVLTSMPIQTQ